MSPRLSLAIQAGVPIPDEGRIAVFHPRGDADLSALPADRVLAIQPMRPDHDALVARGFACAATLPEGERFAASVVFATRAKGLGRDLVARASACTEGPVLVDGAKTDGIDSLIKPLLKQAQAHAPISKAHGKICWFAGGVEMPDWRAADFTDIGGYVTAPGVFSADGIDPASALLAQSLPVKLGRRVADLGAGWGYLSAQILTHDAVEVLHMVEADHAALDCARRNVTDARAQMHWADACGWAAPEPLDTVVMNPPFHTGRAAEPALGQSFIDTAARVLTPSGQLWLVANRHLPYETRLSEKFAQVEEIAGDNRFKVLHASRPKRQRR
ncbi:class I SAM-dependent methyltransferase [Rhodobacteraceae bacterium M382]|nr:class I SAM-dependent methyltransferase [Rhodobacteraceae bacterium M382]